MSEKKSSGGDFRYAVGEAKVPWHAVGEYYDGMDAVELVKFLLPDTGEGAYAGRAAEVEAAIRRLAEVAGRASKLTLGKMVAEAEELAKRYFGSRYACFVDNWTGGMEMSPSGRFRVIEEAKPKQRFLSRDGIRWDVAWIAIAAVIILCIAVLLADLAGMGISSRAISRLDAKIADQGRRNDGLKQELTVSSGDVSVCTEAVKLNLISGYGAATVMLTVPSEYSAGAVTADFRGAATGWMTASIGD